MHGPASAVGLINPSHVAQDLVASHRPHPDNFDNFADIRAAHPDNFDNFAIAEGSRR